MTTPSYDANQWNLGPMPPPETPGRVTSAVHAVMAALGKRGIAKSRENVDQSYFFRGIDQVYAALNPLLVEHGLIVLPRVLTRLTDARQTRSGGSLYNVALEMAYRVVAVTDGSSLPEIVVWGEGSDTADKATNKAMSAAYKYFAIQLFCIPVEGDEDADRTTPEDSRPAPPPEYDEFARALDSAAKHGTAELNRVWKAAPSRLREYYDADPSTDRPRLRARALAADAEAGSVA